MKSFFLVMEDFMNSKDISQILRDLSDNSDSDSSCDDSDPDFVFAEHNESSSDEDSLSDGTPTNFQPAGQSSPMQVHSDPAFVANEEHGPCVEPLSLADDNLLFVVVPPAESDNESDSSEEFLQNIVQRNFHRLVEVEMETQIIDEEVVDNRNPHAGGDQDQNDSNGEDDSDEWEDVVPDGHSVRPVNVNVFYIHIHRGDWGSCLSHVASSTVMLISGVSPFFGLPSGVLLLFVFWTPAFGLLDSCFPVFSLPGIFSPFGASLGFSLARCCGCPPSACPIVSSDSKKN
uniref:Uncharacterized protein n=1 Tax=Cacopsylla melanoneura TaxID=428564 RepID=A0A8D9E6Q8_9HEMI